MSIHNWGLICMNKKRKYFLRRLLAPLLILAVCVSCFAVTALADSFATDLNNDSFIDLRHMGYVPANHYFSSGNTFSFSLPATFSMRYVDIYCNMNFTPTSVVWNGRTLNCDNFQGTYYRIYGAIIDNGPDYSITFNGADSSSWIVFNSFNVRNVSTTLFHETAGICVFPSANEDWIYMQDSDSEVYYPIASIGDEVGGDLQGNPDFTCYVDLHHWRNYEYMDVYLLFYTTGIKSISATFDGAAVPFSYSFLDSAPGPNDGGSFNEVLNHNVINQYLVLRFDLRGLDRRKSFNPEIVISGDFGFSRIYDVTLMSCTGYNSAANVDSLYYYFQDLFSKLDDIFSGDSPQQEVIDNATDVQTQLNQTVNVEIENAVTDWNANVDIVSGGANNAIAASQVPLAWLSSLADRIFTNMGWFGNIYFTCGFLAVFMLILSKSGIASRVKSSFSSSEPKSASTTFNVKQAVFFSSNRKGIK